MVKLKSVSNPVAAGLESVAVEPRRVLPGGAGRQPGASNLAAEHLLARGKGDPIGGPTFGATALESVIGSDDRTRILETASDPWRMICALRIRSPFGTFIGTAWFVGPRTLLTAGHCVFSSAMGGWAERIEVSPGRNDAELPFGTVTSERFSTVDRWVEAQDPDFDVAAIHLAAPLGEETGWFAVGTLPAAGLEGFMVNVSGYPLDRGSGRQQWFHTNRVLRSTARRVFYDVDTVRGQSGSPVWIYESDDAEPLGVAIHAYGIGATPASFGITANSAPRIIPEVLDQIEAWIESDRPDGC